MNEILLSYIWMNQFFSKKNLKTTQGKKIKIINQGVLNKNQGPDFLNCQIEIDDIIWFGNIELHTKSLDWKKHKHEKNFLYENVILHVVWEENQKIFRLNQKILDTLELKNICDQKIAKKYFYNQNISDKIPCFFFLENINQKIIENQLSISSIEKLESNFISFKEKIKNSNPDLEIFFYKRLGYCFGLKENCKVFYNLIEKIDFNFLQKCEKLIDLESFLFKAAGFLEDKIEDEYFNELVENFEKISKKNNIKLNILKKNDWTFCKVRPNSFPTKRIAQFCKLIFEKKNLMKNILEDNLENIICIFRIEESTYWQNHYNFQKKIKKKIKIGSSFINNLIINFVCPFLYFFGKENNEQKYIDRSIFFLKKIKSEKNFITNMFKNLKFSLKSSFESQGVLSLYKNLCSQKKCLDCCIGKSILIKNV